MGIYAKLKSAKKQGRVAAGVRQRTRGAALRTKKYKKSASPTTSKLSATRTPELKKAFGDLDAALRAARRARRIQKEKKAHAREAKNASMTSRSAPLRHVPPHEEPPCLEAEDRPRAQVGPSPDTLGGQPSEEMTHSPQLVAFHVLAMEDVRDADNSEVEVVSVSYALSSGTWGTFFANDRSCLQFLPRRCGDAMGARTSSAAGGASNESGGTSGDGSPVCPTSVPTDDLGFLHYINPSGHSFILAAEGPVAWSNTLSLADVHRLRERAFPYLPVCLVGKLAWALRTRTLPPPPPPPSPPPSMNANRTAMASLEARNKLACGWLSALVDDHTHADEAKDTNSAAPTRRGRSDEEGDARHCTARTPRSQLLFLRERQDPIRWWRPMSAALSETQSDVSISTWSKAIEQVSGAEVAGASAEAVFQADDGASPQCWLAPHLVRAMCTRGAHESHADNNSPAAGADADAGRCELVFGNVIVPYPSHTFYHHPDEIY